jgi:hypothetical protein
MAEQNKEEILELGEDQLDQLQELLSGSESDKLPPIVLEVEQYDLDEFQRGIKDASYLAGTITAILNAGVSEGFVLDYLLNKETIKHNLETARINKDMNVEMSKNHKATQEKYEL